LYGPGTQPPSWPSGIPLATLVEPAKFRTRIIAALLDTVIMFAASLALYLASGLFKAWTLDPEWSRQYGQNPDVLPNVPAIHADLNLVFATSVVIAVGIVAYAALCWWKMGALPGQRAMGIRILDFDTGKQVSFTAALLRSLAIYAPVGAMMCGYSLITFERLATVPLGQTGSDLNPYGLSPSSPLMPWLDVIAAGVVVGLGWFFLLAVTTAIGSMRRGIQDRIAGSIAIVVRRWPQYAAWGPYPYPGTGPAGGPGTGPIPGPVPGWTPPGSWTPPGQEVPTDWAPPAAPPAGVPGTPGIPGTPPEWHPLGSPPPPGVPPWKAQGSADRSSERAQPTSLESATVARRVAAYLVDSSIVFMLFSFAAATISPGPANATLPNERISILAGLAGGGIQLVYFVLGWTLWRGTLGQRLMGVFVVLEADGKGMSAMDALVRWAVVQGPFALVTIVPLMVAPLVAFGAACWSAFLLYSTQADANRQGIHDHFLGTKVVAAA
jgi:uncharacterized RDD family membrane protein YckC